jgi:hypothetical protein
MHWVEDVGDAYMIVGRKAMDPGNRTYEPADFTVVIVSI